MRRKSAKGKFYETKLHYQKLDMCLGASLMRHKMKSAGYSFLAAFVGWLLPFAGFLLFIQIKYGHINDFDFLLFWPLFFTLLGWFFVALPLIFFAKEKLRSLRNAILLFTTATTLTFLAIEGLTQFGIMLLIWWPVFLGIIGGSVYWALEKTKAMPVWLCWIIPFLFFPFAYLILQH